MSTSQSGGTIPDENLGNMHGTAQRTSENNLLKETDSMSFSRAIASYTMSTRCEVVCSPSCSSYVSFCFAGMERPRSIRASFVQRRHVLFLWTCAIQKPLPQCFSFCPCAVMFRNDRRVLRGRDVVPDTAISSCSAFESETFVIYRILLSLVLPSLTPFETAVF